MLLRHLAFAAVPVLAVVVGAFAVASTAKTTALPMDVVASSASPENNVADADDPQDAQLAQSSPHDRPRENGGYYGGYYGGYRYRFGGTYRYIASYRYRGSFRFR